MKNKQDIVIVDDHTLFRLGLQALLARAGYLVVAQAANGFEAVEKVAQYRPALTILDISMPGMNGIETAREILRRDPSAKILAVTMFEDEVYVQEALKAGIRGYVLKTQAAAELIVAVETVLGEFIYLSPKVSSSNWELSCPD